MATKNVSCTLHWSEVFMAGATGVLQKAEAIKAGRGDSVVDKPDKWWREIEGKCAELAVAKVLDKFWCTGAVAFDTADFQQRKRFDVGRLQVRNSDLADGCLIVRPKDSTEDMFVLVIGESPHFRIVGCMAAREAKQQKYWRKDAWWVPQCDLHGLEILNENASCEEEEELEF